MTDVVLDPDWLLREDLALKDALKGLTVTDGNNSARPVGVWFGQPDPEIRQQSYPYITVDLIDILENTTQVQSQYGPISDHQYLLDKLGAYDPTTQDQVAEDDVLLPMVLVYQVSSWARQPRHDRAILNQLNNGTLHPRFAQVGCDDGTNRRLVIRQFAKRDATVDGKRLFRNIWTVAMISELFAGSVALTQRVQQVMINPETQDPDAPDSALTPIYYP